MPTECPRKLLAMLPSSRSNTTLYNTLLLLQLVTDLADTSEKGEKRGKTFKRIYISILEKIVAVDPKSVPSAHQFTVVIDGVETAIHEGVLRCSGGGTVAVVAPGVIEVSRLQHVVVRGGGGGDVRFSRCEYAAAEDCGAASFHRCGAVRVDGARGVSVRRCRSADVERAGAVAIGRCKGAARVRGAGELRVGRCREADVGGCTDAAVARCRAARADWCGAVALGRVGSADVTRCGAVRVDRCRDASVSGCGAVAVRRGKVNVVEVHKPASPPMYQQQVEPVLAAPLAIMNK